MVNKMNPKIRPVNEIFEEVSKTRSKAKRAEILKAHDFLHIRDILRASFDDTLQFDLPEGEPPFDANETIEREGHIGKLKNETKRFTYLIKGSPMGKNMLPIKKEKIWVQILEGSNPDDVPVLTAMKDKELHVLYKGLTKELVKEVWPNLIRK
jgi:hypothetical protein